uniref:cytochrome c oxidase assembly protein COX20, mitochondrial isoform X2 n=1 Tax=Solea senegalensis TaxID=28829 RepID=UPI001CD8E8D8|nr:cytochrome c oxidase assembly protein COX20, mitochondrial isoform X2 [Solea senegalensis]
MAGEEQEKNDKGFRLPGFVDVQRTPCAREALLHGAAGSLVAGLLHFLATSVTAGCTMLSFVFSRESFRKESRTRSSTKDRVWIQTTNLDLHDLN